MTVEELKNFPTSKDDTTNNRESLNIKTVKMSQGQKNCCNDKIYDKDMKGKESIFLLMMITKYPPKSSITKERKKSGEKSEINENYFSKLITS